MTSIPSTSASAQWTVRDAASILFKGAAALVALAGTSTLAGHVFQAGSQAVVKSQIPFHAVIGFALKEASKVAFVVGKYAFLTVSVPVYAVYQGIKWTILEGIPKAATELVSLIKSLWEKILVPIGQFLLEKATQLKNHVIVPALTALKDMAISVGKTLFNRVIVPIAEGLHKLGKILETFFGKVYDYVLVPFGNFAKSAITAIYNKILVPLGEKLKDLTIRLFENVIIPLGEKLIDFSIRALDRLYHHVLAPLGRGLTQLATSVINALEWFFTHTAEVARAIYDKIIVPAAQIVSDVAAVLFQNVISPAFTFLWDITSATAKALYHNVLSPIGQVCGEALKVLGNMVSSVASAIFTNIIEPGFTKTLEVVYLAGKAVGDGFSYAANEVIKTATYLSSLLAKKS